MIVKVLIADDDHTIGSHLKKLIEEIPGVSVVDVVSNGKDAVKKVEYHSPQVVFLDVDMPEMTGIEAARELAEIKPGLNIVFVTAHADFALKAFELYAFDYILKPFKEERVKKTVKKLKEQVFREQSVNNQKLGFLIEVNGRSVLVNFNDIIFIESREHKIFIKSVKGEYLTPGDLSTIEKRLNPQGFFRCHKGYIVNIAQMKEVVPVGRSFEIIMQSGDRVLMSREKEKVLREKLKIG